MGLFSLFARKLNPEKYQTQVRAPPFESKISSKSALSAVQPASVSAAASEENYKAKVRLVTSPKAQALPPQSSNSSSEDEAPAPVILGFRENSPSSPSARLLTSSRHSLLAPRAGSSSAASYRPQSSVSSRRHSASMRSSSTASHHIDLLDAQSEFRPLDFHGRVIASGARDYGEDVADRNINANKNMHNSPAPVSRGQRRLSSPWSFQAPALREEDEKHEMSKQATFHAKKMTSATEMKKKALLQSMRCASPSGLEEFHSTPSLAELHAIVEQQELVERDTEHADAAFSAQPTPLHQSPFWANSDRTVSPARPLTMQSLQSVKSLQRQLQITHDARLMDHARGRAMTLEQDWNDDYTDQDTAPSPCIKTNRSRSHSRNSYSTQEHYPAANRSTSQQRSSPPIGVEDGLTHASRQSSLSIVTPITPSFGTMDAHRASPPLERQLFKDSNDTFLVPSSGPMIIDDYNSDDSDSFVDGNAGRPENDEDLLFINGYGVGGLQLPGLAVPFTAAPPAAVPVSRSRPMSSASHSDVGGMGAGLDFNDLMSVNSMDLAGSSTFDDDASSFSSSPYNIGRRGRRRHSPEPAEQTLRAASPVDSFVSAMSWRSDSKCMIAVREPALSAVGSHNSLWFHRRSSQHHPQHGNNVGEQAIEEERYDDAVDVAASMVQRRASMMTFTQPSSAMVKAVSIDSLCRSSSSSRRQSSAKKGIPNIVDVPELTEDVGGHIDYE